MSKPFVLLLTIVLVLGGSLGGAFAGGVALGKSRAEDTGGTSFTAAFGLDSQQPSAPLGLPQRDQLRQGIQSGNFGQQDLEQLRQRFGSGELGQQDRDQLRRQFQEGTSPFADGRGFPGRAGRTGTIEKVDNGTLTLETADGPIQVSIPSETPIRIFSEAVLADLEAGLRVTVIGQQAEDGTVAATSILVIPEGLEGSFPLGFSPRDGFGRGGASGRDDGSQLDGRPRQRPQSP